MPLEIASNIPDIIKSLVKVCNASPEPSLATFLPLLRFEGHPYSLKFHFQLEPLYRLRQPRRVVFMTGRQVGKSQGLVSSLVLRCGLIPNYHVMICEPQFMQVRHISNVTFRNMVAQAYIANYLVVPENERLSSRKPFGPVRRAFQGEVAKDVHLVVLRYGPFPVFLQQEIHLVHRYEFPVRKDGVVIEMTTTNHEFHAVSFFIRSLTESSSRHAR